MVNRPLLEAIIRRLELFFLKENNFQLQGKSYDLILFMDAGWRGNNEYNLLLSAQLLDSRSQREVIHTLLSDFRKIPSYQEYHVLAGLTILKSTAQVVRQAQQAFRYRTSIDSPLIEVAGFEVDLGDEPSRGGLFARAVLLEQLKANAVLEVQFSTDGGISSQIRTIQVGHVDQDMTLHGTLVRYTPERSYQATVAPGFRIPLLQVQRVRPEANSLGYQPF